MHTPVGIGQVFQDLRSRVLDFLLTRCISKHGKRILFITSLYAQLVRRDQLRIEAVSKLNVLMDLSSSDSALRFPSTFTSMIWQGTELGPELVARALEPNLPEESIWDIAARMVSIAPGWMPYARRDVMVHDVFNLIQGCRETLVPTPSLAMN